MTCYYQTLDLTTNKWAKEFLKTKFSQWYSKQIQDVLDSSKAIEDIEVKVPLSVMKPLHGCWLIELTSARYNKVIKSGSERSEILDIIALGSKSYQNQIPLLILIHLSLMGFLISQKQKKFMKNTSMMKWSFSTKVWDQNGKKIKPVIPLIFSTMTIERTKLLCYLLCYSFVNHFLYFNVKDR